MEHIYRLTPRQQEVNDLLGQNYSLAAIARMLNIHRETVKTHKAHIVEKIEALKLYALDIQTRPVVYAAPMVETWMPWK